MNWYLYIAQCNDGSLYTGITIDISRRINEHNKDNVKGAKSLRGKRPIKLVYYEKYNTQSEARKRESAIKKWDRQNKFKLIARNKAAGLPCKQGH